MNPTSVIRSTAAFALGSTATVLTGSAKALSFLASRLRGTVADAPSEPVRGVVDRVADAEEDAPAAPSPKAETEERLENVVGMTSGAPPDVDELFPAPIQAAPTLVSPVETAGSTDPADLVVPAEVTSPTAEPAPGPADLDPVPGGVGRTFESQTAALAAKPAGEVVRAVRGMSTDELEALLDYEMSHRKRKTVLGAIERELAPPNEELVYSSPDR